MEMEMEMEMETKMKRILKPESNHYKQEESIYYVRLCKERKLQFLTKEWLDLKYKCSNNWLRKEKKRREEN